MIDWIQDFVNKIFQIVFWKTLLSKINWIDWITVAFVLLGIVYGIRKGFLRMIAEILEFMVILYVTFFCQKPLADFLSNTASLLTPRAAEPVAFIVIALPIWFLIAVLDRHMQKWVHGKLTGIARGLGGAFLGGFYFILIWSFISQAVILYPYGGLSKLYKTGGSVTGTKIKALAPVLYSIVMNPEKTLEK